MNSAFASEAVATSAEAESGRRDILRLQESFLTFNRVTRDLESAYRALKERADRMDARLQEANAALVRKVAEMKLSSARLQAVLDAVPCGVVTCDAAGMITTVNRAAERILGCAARELVGRDARAVRGKDGEPLLMSGVDATSSFGEKERGALDGARRRTSSSVTILPGGERLEILTDLTEVALLRSQLNRLDTLAALGEMAGGIAHEIRNPLNGVEGFAGLLERALEGDAPPDRAALARYADRIRRGVFEVNEIITNLLLWAKPERVVRSTFSLRALLEETANAAASDVAARVETALGDDELRIDADRVKLKIVFSNLIRNAIEAAGPSGRVRISTSKDGAQRVVAVDDSGPGLSEEMRRRLYRPFSTDKASGTGLGLAIAKKLTDVHGAELSYARGPLGGARFCVTFGSRSLAGGNA